MEKKMDAEPLIFSEMVKDPCVCEFEDCTNYHKIHCCFKIYQLEGCGKKYCDDHTWQGGNG